MSIIFPNRKKFAFTIIDDTDDGFLENIKPVYDFLFEKGFRTTKTVWVYPVRDNENAKGDSLQNSEYLKYVKLLIERGFEIALHNVGSGKFYRSEILDGIEKYRDLLGVYPKIHINHSYNPDNIYSGEKRFAKLLRPIVKKIYPQYFGKFSGDIQTSQFFWGDKHKQLIKFARNYEFETLNILKKVPELPYRDKEFIQYSNYWFASTFAPNQWVFNHIINENAIDKLEEEGGVGIVYTHFGYYKYENGKIDESFKRKMEYLSKKEGWFVPVSELLEFLLKNKKNDRYISEYRKLILSLSHLFTRIKFRKLLKIDDYYFRQKYPI